MVKLGELLKSQPKSKVKAGEGLVGGAYKFFTSSNVQNKFLNEFQYMQPALIFGTGGNASVHYCDEPFSTSTDCLVFYSNSNDLALNYIFKYLSGNMNLLENGFKGAGLKHISKDYILGIEIPLPPLDEQKQIAEELDKISGLIAKRKSQLEKLDLLVKAKFVEMFGDPVTNPMGWEKVTLESIFVVTSSKRIYQTQLVLEGVPFFKISDLIRKIDGKKVTNLSFIPEKMYNEYASQSLVPQEGDILVTSRGTLGKCYNVKKGDKFYFQDGMISWLKKGNKSICNIFFITLFDTEDIKRQISNDSSGATVEYISIDKLRNLEILYPPLPLQTQFDNYVTKVEQTKTKLQHGLEQLETLYKARMQEYFE